MGNKKESIASKAEKLKPYLFLGITAIPFISLLAAMAVEYFPKVTNGLAQLP